jgi:hypothetical protein
MTDDGVWHRVRRAINLYPQLAGFWPVVRNLHDPIYFVFRRK